MIDLKSVIEKYPECLESSEKLKAYLNDLYPNEKARTNIIVTIFKSQILYEIKNSINFDDVFIHNCCIRLQDDYGYSLKLSRDCMEQWINIRDTLVYTQNKGGSVSSMFNTDESKMSSNVQSDNNIFTIVGNIFKKYKKCQKNIIDSKNHNHIDSNTCDKVLDLCENVEDTTTKSNNQNNNNDFEIVGGILKKYKGNQKNVIIPKTVLEIGNNAFSGYSLLSSVIIPESVKIIGTQAFSGCDSLTNITIPNSVEKIEESAFSRCCSLTTVIIPDSVKNLGKSAFSRCHSLKSVTFPSSIDYIDDSVFKGCPLLTDIPKNKSSTNLMISTTKNNSTSVCNRHNNNTLKIVNISPKKNREKNHLSAQNHYSINDFEVVDGVLKKYNGKSKKVIIPNIVKSIGDMAFLNCDTITNVIITNSVKNIGRSAFSGCVSLKSVIIPSSVKSINKSAFYECSSLESITIPNSITSIKQSTFSHCDKLKFITIPNSVTSIAKYAFYGCHSLTDITIPNSVKNIGESAFSNCSSLKNVIMPKRMKNMTASVFEGCKLLTNNPTINISSNKTVSKTNSITAPINITNSTNDFKIVNGILKKYTGHNTKVVIPKNVIEIGNCAFLKCNFLTSISILNNVERIGVQAFCGCNSLKSVTIPNSVTSIGHSAFAKCDSLKNITIPNSVTSIDGVAFGRGTNLEILCGSGSYAEKYAKQYKIKYKTTR